MTIVSRDHLNVCRTIYMNAHEKVMTEIPEKKVNISQKRAEDNILSAHDVYILTFSNVIGVYGSHKIAGGTMIYDSA